jgi:hypothetical protein
MLKGGERGEKREWRKQRSEDRNLNHKDTDF